jgi:hypothetical protein
MERGVMETPPPRKRGRPPKNAKLANYPASTGSQSNSRTDVAQVTKPDAAMVNHNNNNNNSNSDSRKADAKEGDDLEMIEGGTIPPSRPGQRGRPKKSLMAKKGEPAGKASGSSISDRELLKSELQDEELPVERTPEKPATRKSKKPSQVRSLQMEFFFLQTFCAGCISRRRIQIHLDMPENSSDPFSAKMTQTNIETLFLTRLLQFQKLVP